MASTLSPSSLLALVPPRLRRQFYGLARESPRFHRAGGRAFFSSSPAWVDGLFALRNRLVALFGLKTFSAGAKERVIRDFQCEVGERVGL